MKAAKRLGAVLQEDTCIKAIKVKRNRVESVVTSKGEIKTNVVINAAGTDARRIANMVRMDIPIMPARGQILITEALPHILKYQISVSSASEKTEYQGPYPSYIQPTLGGNLLVGATKEYGVDETKVTLATICQITRWFAKVFPAILEFNIIRSWAGIRPMSPDESPLIGKSREIQGFFIAAGHSAVGINLASGTGEMISHLVVGEGLDPEFVEAFDPRRFSDRAKSAFFSSLQ